MRPEDNPTLLHRNEIMERTLKDIVNLAEKNPENLRLQQARILAESALNALPADR